jgi:ferredoxin
VDHPGFGLGLAVAAVFLGVLALGALAPRFWCRSLCPLGALLGFSGRFAPLRRHVAEECSSCGICERACKMGAIPAEVPERTLTAECILCWNCVACPSTANHIGWGRGGNQAERGLDTSKRAFLQAVGLGAVSGLVLATGAARRPRHERLLRPPGANTRSRSGELKRMDEQEFRGRCIRCGACMRACPTGGLQPAVAQAGFDGVFTPVLIPTVGWCEKTCKTCGEVCPTGALQPFTVEEKPQIKLGLATVHQDRCLSWRKGNQYRLCVVCNEVCQYQAVEARQVQGETRPVVVVDKCTGCGICENKCPIKPGSAIEVFRAE